ncbi:MAG TPA: hypothetical protein VJP60_04735 [Rhizomicrobium sp.]|nr:hypothetical protein [Rhizomicrobium sp.]
MIWRSLGSMLIAGTALWPVAAFAYRPFDSTDAAVADDGKWEVEAAPLNWRHNDRGSQWIAPALILNYGFAPRWEAVVEGRNTIFGKGRDEFSDAAASLKTVIRDGSFQDRPGVSLGSEFSVLLPGIGADSGAGLEWTMLASHRQDWGAWHLNLGPMLTRDGHGGMVAGGILEGPASWPFRPVAEIRYEKAFGGEELIAGLVGLIVPVREGLALDIGLRHAREGGHPDEQLRAGVTFDLN